jgi:hypothetical protein
MLAQEGLGRAIVQRVVEINFGAAERVSIRITIQIMTNLVIRERVAGVTMSLGSEQGPF